MAARKRNVKAEKAAKKKEEAQKVENGSDWTRIVLIIGVLLATMLLIKVQFAAVHQSTLLSSSGFRPGPAIVTTWKGVSRAWATSWIQYHAALGFTRLFIFWDDPQLDRETIDLLKNDPLYSWVVDSYEPDEEYKLTYWTPNATSKDYEQRVLPAYGVHADTEITARQSLYAVRAAQIGAAEGVSWLLHIDADELFSVDKEQFDGGAGKVFENLSAKKFTHAAFFNDEIMPESASYTDKKQEHRGR